MIQELHKCSFCGAEQSVDRPLIAGSNLHGLIDEVRP